jgi:hypothetical protein
MERLRVVACAVVLSCLCGPAGSSAATAPAVIKLLSVTVTATTSAVPRPTGLPSGETPYREVTMRDRLYNGVGQFGRPRLAQIGTDTATELHFRAGREWISVVTKLPGGTLYTRGDLRRVGGVAIGKVTGGTGRYAGVRGTLTILDLPYRGLAANVYRLTR